MNDSRRHVYVASLVGATVVVAAIIVGMASLLGGVIDQYHLWKMTEFASGDQLELEVRLADRQDMADSLLSVVETLSARRLPDIQTFKALAGDHQLRLRKMEKVSDVTDNSGSRLRYTATLEGTVGRLVSFLKGLEVDYILQTTQVSFYPVDAEGNTIAMRLILTVRPS